MEKHPFIILISIISSVITIWIFLTGIPSLPDIFNRQKTSHPPVMAASEMKSPVRENSRNEANPTPQVQTISESIHPTNQNVILPNPSSTTGPFIFQELVAVDKRTNLTWLRNGNIGKNKMDYHEAKTLIHEINESNYGGFNDWRFPTKLELLDMLQLATKAGFCAADGEMQPGIKTVSPQKAAANYFNAIGFNNVQAQHYWTKSNVKNRPKRIFIINFWAGNTGASDMTETWYVWLVSDGKGK